ncbi:cytochrome P450 [Thozetella sp. PMI_491]|nr:cytochrome P450 [Thozetella sp. PMI_491]
MLMMDLAIGWATYVVYSISVGLLVLASYRLLFHPLRDYPGPFLARLTGGYSGYYTIQKRVHLEVLKLHGKYGSVVRLAPNRLVFNTATALRDIYQNDQVTKAYTYTAIVRHKTGNTFSTIDNDEHRAKRKLIAPAISDRAMRAFEPTMIEQIDVYLRQMLELSRTSQAADMTAKTKYLALDVVGKLAFGYDLGLQKREENRFVLKAITYGNYRLNIFQQLPELSRFYSAALFDYLFYDAREKYWRLLETMIRSRRAEKQNARADLYSFIADTLPSESESVRWGHFWREALFFIIAGGDTVAAATCAAFFYLTRNPDCYKRLADEIRKAFESGHDIKTGPQLAACTYLRACIDEAMRMSPPLSSMLWREQVAGDSRPFVVDGHVIPRGTLVSVTAYALHHNEEYFPDSFAFRPERWLAPISSPGDTESGAKLADKVHLDAFAPFSVGPRACGGKAMAYMEASLVLAKTIWYFDFEAAPGPLGSVGAGNPSDTTGRHRLEEFQLYDILTARHEGPWIVLRERGEACKELEVMA